MILVSQLSWKTWQTCTSGRKAAPGEFVVVESELWSLSSALEQLATLWAADVDEKGIPREMIGLPEAVRHSEQTIKEFDRFLDKYRLPCATPGGGPIKWTQRAKNNWTRIMWGTEKETLNDFRARIDRHILSLNILINLSER